MNTSRAAIEAGGDFVNRAVVITGAAGGMGRAFAEAFGAAGASVAMIDREEAAVAAARDYVVDTGATKPVVIREVDVADPDRVAEVAADLDDDLGGIDVLVNAAGITASEPSDSASPDVWRRVLDVNLNGVFWCCQAIGRHMLARRRGSIINIASMSGLIVNRPQPQAAYNVSKAGVIMLTKSLAAEWAPRGVRVNAVAPGYVRTPMTQHRVGSDVANDYWLPATPMGRMAEPEEITGAVMYFAADTSSFTTGAVLSVDGGYTAW